MGSEGRWMADSNPLEFLQEVREETNKVTWPSRKELVVSTIMVLIMVTVASLFFTVADAVIKLGTEFLFFGK
jgi:preprotein translocase subunit SecE